MDSAKEMEIVPYATPIAFDQKSFTKLVDSKTERTPMPNSVRLSANTDIRGIRSSTQQNDWVHIPSSTVNDPNTHLAKKKLNEKLIEQIKQMEQ